MHENSQIKDRSESENEVNAASRDAVADLLRAAGEGAGTYETHMAKALLRRLFPKSRRVVFLTRYLRHRWHEDIQGGRASFDNKNWVRSNVIPPFKAQQILKGFSATDPEVIPIGENFRSKLYLHDHQLALVFSTSARREADFEEESWIILDQDCGQSWVSAIHRSTQAPRELHAAIQALRKAGHLFRIRQQVERLRYQKTELLSVRMDQARKLINEVRFHASRNCTLQYARILSQMGAWVIQEVLGTDWINKSEDAVVHSREVPEFYESLVKAIQLILRRRKPDWSREEKEEISQECEVFIHLYENWKDWTSPNESARPLKHRLGLLLHWDRLFQLGLRLVRQPSQFQDRHDIAYIRAIKQSIPVIERMLEEEWKTGLSKVNFGAWLNLWLAYTLMTKMMSSHDDLLSWRGKAILKSERWRFRADLAFLIREGLRQAEFGSWPDFTFDADEYIRALCTVVEHHAYWIVGVPRDYDLRRMLRAIGKARHPDDYPFSSAHLQHALQVYIAGHFIAQLRIQAGKGIIDGWGVEEVLATRTGLRPGKQSVQEFLQAFSIAALYHDVGMLLTPRIFFEVANLCSGSEELRRYLSGVGDSVKSSAAGLMKQCERELLEAKYFDPNQELSLARWIHTQRKKGRPDHSLLGAWFLHRISEAEKETNREVTRQAVRGVLLHQVSTQAVDTSRDAVASLLILCDELFEWMPSRKKRTVQEMGLSIQGFRELDVRPEGSRASHIHLPDIGHSGDGKWTIRLDEDEIASGWPRIRIRLKEPDHLDLPIYQIWLSMYQNLSRLMRSPLGWGPVVEIESPVPGQLRQAGLTTQEALKRLANISRVPYRVRLEQWVEAGERFQKVDDKDKEILTIRALRPNGALIFSDSLASWFDKLDGELEKVVQDAQSQRSQ